MRKSNFITILKSTIYEPLLLTIVHKKSTLKKVLFTCSWDLNYPLTSLIRAFLPVRPLK